MEQFQHFTEYIQYAIRTYWNDNALSDYEGATLSYKEVARQIEKLHLIFESAGVKKGDRVALCGRNSAHWGVAFMGVVTYGAVAVPILSDFLPDQVHDIVNHSEARLLFVGDVVGQKLDADAMPQLKGILRLTDFSLQLTRCRPLTHCHEHLNERFGQKYPKSFGPSDVSYYIGRPDDLALINYTSGTTASNSKGVMIPYRALWSNLLFAIDALGAHVKHRSRVISILPMAHMYGMMFEFIFEFSVGCHVYFLGRLPSPKVIFQAFSDVRPDIVIAVPLIVEKIVRKAVLPKLQRPAMKLLMHVPYVNKRIAAKVRQALITAFGGHLYEIIIGGAALNSEIERFLTHIDFPFTVGYGTTECAPIISYVDWHAFRSGSCGKVVPRMELRIDSVDPTREVGEILVRGANVMLGYYKNPEATRQAIDADGWYHTGDLGVVDADGYLYIRGRSKNMLLGASGQNIYPEDIEDKLSGLPYVGECIVVQRNEKLYGLVHPDYETAEKDGLGTDDMQRLMEKNRTSLNAILPAYEQLTGIVVFEEPFEKTPKKSIKRYLYADVVID